MRVKYISIGSLVCLRYKLVKLIKTKRLKWCLIKCFDTSVMRRNVARFIFISIPCQTDAQLV